MSMITRRSDKRFLSSSKVRKSSLPSKEKVGETSDHNLMPNKSS